MVSIDTPDDQLYTGIFEDGLYDNWEKYPQISLSELAARNGAMQAYDNRGRQIWTEGFDSAIIHWNTTIVGGASIVRSTDTAWMGLYSAKINIPLASPCNIEVWKRFYHPQTGMFSIEFTWSCDIIVWNNFRIGFYIYDGTYKWNFVIDKIGLGSTFYMREEGFGNRNVASMSAEYGDIFLWHKTKIVADILHGVIPRIMIDGNETDISQYTVEHTLDASLPHIVVFIRVSSTNNPMNLYMDNIIFSHLEP